MLTAQCSIRIVLQVDGSSGLSAGTTYSHDLSSAAVSIETLFLGCCKLEADFSHQITVSVESSDANSISIHNTTTTPQMTDFVHSLEAERRTAYLYEHGKAYTFGVICSDLPDDSFTGETCNQSTMLATCSA